MNGEVIKAFEALKKHPYTVISLSDREKFHTGMLSFVINNLEPDAKLKFIKALWGEDIGLETGESISSTVEHDSIDLVVKQYDKTVLWAEMKFKTTLSKGQIDKYQKKMETKTRPRKSQIEYDKKKPKGALFALFTGIEDLPENFREACFHDEIIKFKEHIRDNLPEGDGDIETLIRLWIEYLEAIQILTRYVVDTAIKSIPDLKIDVDGKFRKFGDMVHEIKLKGIFEHYRHSLFRKEVYKIIESNENLKNALEIGQFNSHGNSGIEHFVHPYPDIEIGDENNPSKRDGHMRYGLMWQAGSLKLGIDVEKDAYYSPEKLEFLAIEKNKIGSNRDAKLETLYNKFAENDVWADPKLNRNNNSETKFRSFTIEKWDIFNPQLRVLGSDPKNLACEPTLKDLAIEYVERLNFLVGEDCQEFVKNKCENLPDIGNNGCSAGVS